MGKTIRLSRRELVWEYRDNSWDENDYKNLLDWLKGFKEKNQDDPGHWYKDHVQEYEVLSQYTWDQICEYINNFHDDEPTVTYYDEKGEKRYSQGVSDIIRDYIREDNYSSDISDAEYADDFDEDWFVVDDR